MSETNCRSTEVTNSRNNWSKFNWIWFYIIFTCHECIQYIQFGCQLLTLIGVIGKVH